MKNVFVYEEWREDMYVNAFVYEEWREYMYVWKWVGKKKEEDWFISGGRQPGISGRERKREMTLNTGQEGKGGRGQ